MLAVDFDEYFIDVESVAVALVPSLQTTGIEHTDLDAPQADCFAADSDASLRQEIFNISVTQIEAKVEPNSVGHDVRQESVAFIGIHGSSVAISAS